MKGIICVSVLVLGVFPRASGFAASAPDQALFVAVAGHNSCSKSEQTIRPLGIDMMPSLSQLVKHVKAKNPKFKPLLLAACLYGDAPPEGEAEYFTSRSNKDWSGDTYNILNEIVEIVKSSPGIPVFIMGHSYGGWIAMYLAERLPNAVDIKGLFTIDPIGPDCDTLDVVFSGDACHQAPTDRDNRKIAQRVGSWVNFFQEDDSWLTSSEIKEATRNFLITFSWGPHGSLDSNEEVWGRIEGAVAKVVVP